ncbi:hypothetical protein [Pseudoalteromonas sp. T1lg10]|uniref:hypothetical protein n=1 Tax=Pseudoalteromonas sp. T1lg10 TaxID=2077093 RepID=UPI000CF6B117|nr:hypothetical protein [Pseudoalteromonas sp. T1lg10]
MKNNIFVVNNEPFCLWDEDLKDRNKEFLSGIDTEYFSLFVDMFESNRTNERAALALRTAFHHALETLFSLIGALIQAPNCPYAWIAKYKTHQLKSFVERVNKEETDIFTSLNIERVTWTNLAQTVFIGFNKNTERYKEVVGLYSELWAKLANEFLKSVHHDEYNSIKHGLRIRSGGTALDIATSMEGAFSEKKFEPYIYSENGTTTLKLERISSKDDERSLRVTRSSVNWSAQKTALILQLVIYSIHNVVAKLKSINEPKIDELTYLMPDDDKSFTAPWEHASGNASIKIKSITKIKENMSTNKNTLQEQIDSFMKSKQGKLD